MMKKLHGIDDTRLREILYILDNIRGSYGKDIEEKLEQVSLIIEGLLNESEE
jgi:hypothetical protein